MSLETTIAIDGPAASGKTTVGRLLAEQLDYVLLDTGVMYRAVALAVLQAGIDSADEEAVTAVACAIKIDILPPTVQDGRLYTVLLDGEDVTWALRGEEATRLVSRVSAYAGVRQEMLIRQRQIGELGKIVMVGRDIGTVVLPEAPIKFYVTASAEERARRRCVEEQGRGESADYPTILADILRRDHLDSTRANAPLLPAADAQLIDTTYDTPQAVVASMLSIIQKKISGR